MEANKKVADFFDSVDTFFTDDDKNDTDAIAASLLDLPDLNNPVNLDLLLAAGYHKAGNHSQCSELVERCLKAKPGWKPALLLKESIKDNVIDKGDTTVTSQSQYHRYFVEVKKLGKGGFGSVYLCRHKFDKGEYAVKRIRMVDKEGKAIHSGDVWNEVISLLFLQHRHVVRYYSAWNDRFDDGDSESESEGNWTASLDPSSGNCGNVNSDQWSENQKVDYLCIQMEYCPKTLQDFLKFDKRQKDNLEEDFKRRVSREILLGLCYIHQQGMVHRDLTPQNIFLDSNLEVKIGDLGLAKALENEGEDGDRWTLNSGSHGKPYYKAPEMKTRSKITNKVDVFSFGIIYFELYYAIGSGAEKAEVVSKLRGEEKTEFPSGWELKFPEHASLIRSMLSPKASDRPSVAELLSSSLIKEV